MAACITLGTPAWNFKENAMDAVQTMIMGAVLLVIGFASGYILARRQGRELWRARDGADPYARLARKVKTEESR